MQFDPENTVVRLCAEGMAAEALGRLEEAQCLFRQAWDLAGRWRRNGMPLRPQLMLNQDGTHPVAPG